MFHSFKNHCWHNYHHNDCTNIKELLRKPIYQGHNHDKIISIMLKSLSVLASFPLTT